MDFSNSEPTRPIFKEILNGNLFFGIVWACLNSDRKKIPNKSLRGFLMKKQGFAIGNRDKIAPYFKQRTHFDRYIGEIVLTNTMLLPNASRSDLEFSNYSTMFTEILANEIAPYYNQQSTKYQEQCLAEEQIADVQNYLKILNVNYKRDEKDAKVLVDYIVVLKNKYQILENKDKNSSLKTEQRSNIKTLQDSINFFIKQIQESINNLTNNKQDIRNKKNGIPSTGSQVSFAKKISAIKFKESSNTNYESLIELIIDLDIEISEELKIVFETIDELIIQGYSNSQKEYYTMMRDLRNTILKNLE